MTFRFEVLHRDAGTGARAGRMHTAHGTVDTPVFMPVGTQATVKAVGQDDLQALGAEILLGNTYHLMLRPGEALVQQLGGLHRFMAWPRAILTDSGRLPTGTAFVTYRKDGSREFIFNLANSATSLIDADSVDPILTEGCRFFHVMGTSLTSEGMIAAVKQGIRRIKEGGGKVSFDPNIRREVMSSAFIRDAIDFVLKQCDILLPSEADLQYFCGNLPEAEAVCLLFSKWTLEKVVVKNAAQGSTYYDRTESIHVSSFKVTEVDPTGAGDCFGGTLISCLAQGIDLKRTLTLANAAGALAVTKRGPMEGNTTLSELEPFIASAERTA